MVACVRDKNTVYGVTSHIPRVVKLSIESTFLTKTMQEASIKSEHLRYRNRYDIWNHSVPETNFYAYHANTNVKIICWHKVNAHIHLNIRMSGTPQDTIIAAWRKHGPTVFWSTTTAWSLYNNLQLINRWECTADTLAPTWTLWLSLSATTIWLLVFTVTPAGRLNCPGPDPVSPNFSLKEPSGLNICNAANTVTQVSEYTRRFTQVTIKYMFPEGMAAAMPFTTENERRKFYGNECNL